jgi:putative tricarboxylic transport membrane protein
MTPRDSSRGAAAQRIVKLQMTLNRISGLVVAVFGAILLFWIIPRHTETVDDAWLRPATLPIITIVIVIVSSIVHLIFPSGKAEFDVALALRAGLFFVISLIGLCLMYFVGFLIAAPLLVMVLMLSIGERRPLWLIAGIVLIPLAMWSSIELLLNRPLP